MPLHVDLIPETAGKGQLLRWILETDEVRKQQIGSIEIRGRQAVIEVPDSVGPRLVRRLDGQNLMGRTVQVWFAPAEGESDGTGHFRKLARWLEMEERAESEQAAEWLQTNGEDDSATSLTNLAVRGEDTGLGGYTLLTLGRRNPMQALPASQLGVGSPICLSEQRPNASPPIRGVVTRLDKNEIEVALSKPPEALEPDATHRIDAADDQTAAQRARAALSKAQHARGDRLSELRDICLGLAEPRFEDPVTREFLDPGLNNSQRAAIVFALSALDLAVIHGPPGTGKTTTLVELIRQSVRRGDKVLACAPSNLGVDNLFERLLDQGENAIRIGHGARVLPHLRDRTLRALVPQHRDVKRVKKLRVEARELFRKADRPSGNLSRDARHELRDEAKSMLADARSIEANIAQEIIGNADVVCSTNTGLDPDLLGVRRFDLVVIDEACQCAEPSCWIPLLRAERVVLAGDHCQLPPTILSLAAAEEGYNISLQERLVRLYGDRVSKPLLTQYRMHEHIMRFSSAEFYNNRLEAHPSVADHRLCQLPGVTKDELTSDPVRFIDTSGASYDEEKASAGSSLANPEEATLAVKKVKDLLDRGVPPADIAIITPYTAQVQAVRDLLGNDTVEVGSVDGFQGREKEVVILSLVRSNPEKEIGFLQDVRRMNVALTRARRKLIVIGNSATLSSHPFYERLLSHFDQIDAYHGVWDEDLP